MSATKISRSTAISILGFARAANCDYHALNSSSVLVLEEWAKEIGYRAPAANRRNGSPMRYFHAYLLRIAAREE